MNESNVVSDPKPLDSTPIEVLKSVISKKLSHAKRRLESKIEQNNNRPLTQHGGWMIGYYEGKISLLEDLMDEIDELEQC